MSDAKYDSPRWSYFHGCEVHRGQSPPCPKCIAEGHPDVRRLDSPAPEPEQEHGNSHVDYWMYYNQVMGGSRMEVRDEDARAVCRDFPHAEYDAATRLEFLIKDSPRSAHLKSILDYLTLKYNATATEVAPR